MRELADSRTYFRRRAQQARESAMRAADPGVRRVHLEMARLYAERSHEPDSGSVPLRRAINDG